MTNSSADAESLAELKSCRKFAHHVCTDVLVSPGALIQFVNKY